METPSDGLLAELIYPLSCFVKNVNCFFLFSRFTTSPSSFQPLSSYSFAGYQPRFPPPSSAPPIPPSLSSLNSPLSQYAPPSVSSPVTAMSHSPANAQVSLIFVFLLRFCFKLRFLVVGKAKIPDVEEAVNLIFGSPLTRVACPASLAHLRVFRAGSLEVIKCNQSSDIILRVSMFFTRTFIDNSKKSTATRSSVMEVILPNYLM